MRQWRPLPVKPEEFHLKSKRTDSNKDATTQKSSSSSFNVAHTLARWGLVLRPKKKQPHTRKPPHQTAPYSFSGVIHDS